MANISSDTNDADTDNTNDGEHGHTTQTTGSRPEAEHRSIGKPTVDQKEEHRLFGWHVIYDPIKCTDKWYEIKLSVA